MNFDKDRFFISLQLIPFPAVQKKIQFLGLKIWGLIPNDVKYLENLKDFKTAIKKWKPTSYLCRICKTCLHDVEFLQHVPFKRIFYTF